jgi:formate-dependent nitrite reductase cytochrome c552 subunit
MIALDRWVENLRCPVCRKTGTARLSQTDGWRVHMESVPEGFKVVGPEYASNFYCASCNLPAEP